MNCYVGTCTVGPLFFDFNDYTGFLFLFSLLGVTVSTCLLVLKLAGVTLPDPREWSIMERLADRFESDSD